MRIDDKDTITGIILAGGRAKRMGRPKGLVKLGGLTLIEHAASILAPLCHDILISSNTEDYHEMGYRVIKDSVHYGGPMAGIQACLDQSRSELNLVISCDMPFVPRELFQLLISRIGDQYAAIPWHGKDHYEPVCGVYGKAMAGILERYLEVGTTKLPLVFENEKILKYDAATLTAILGRKIFFNINTKEDLEEAGRILAGH